MTNTPLSRTLAEAANLISNSTSQEKIAEFIISDKKRFYVRVTKHPTNKNALLVTSSIDSPSSGGSPRQISKSDFMSFIKSYDRDNVGPKGKAHYYVDYDDGTYQFYIGETWQKLFLGNSMSQLSPTARTAHIVDTYPKINGYPNWLQAISKSAMNEDIEEAAKASPQEDEFLTDLTKAQIAAIKPLMKSKNWDKLKAYLMSQKIVDKDFEDIQGYKMDRDVLSVLQRSFMDYHEQVENVEEAVGDASSPEAMVRKFNKMTDVNDHTGAAILLATFLKDTKAMKCLKLVKQIHELEGSMPHDIFKYRTAWTTYLWKGFSMKYPQVNRNIINNEPR